MRLRLIALLDDIQVDDEGAAVVWWRRYPGPGPEAWVQPAVRDTVARASGAHM
jgi:hypothetical protein